MRAHDHPDYTAEAEYLKAVLRATELSIADLEARSWRGSGKLADEETDDDRTYTDTPLDGKLLYVALTRALHRLYVLWTGNPSPLLTRPTLQRGVAG